MWRRLVGIQAWQRETERRQEMLARDRPTPIYTPTTATSSPAARNDTPLLSEAVEVSLNNSPSPEVRGAGGHRLGGAEPDREGSQEGESIQSGESLEYGASREPPAMPAAAETRRRAALAAEVRRREASVGSGAGVSSASAGGGGVTEASASEARRVQTQAGVYNGMRPGDVAAPGYLFGGLHRDVPFYVCQATKTSIWELPPAEHLVAVARTQGAHGAESQLRPGHAVPGHSNFVFGGYSNGLPFYHNQLTGKSVWELPRAAPPSEAPGVGGAVVLEEEVPSDEDTVSPSRNPAAVAVSEDMSGEGEVEAMLAARRRPHASWAGQPAPAGAVGAGRGAAAVGGVSEQSQEDMDRDLAQRMQAEFEAEEREQASRCDRDLQQEQDRERRRGREVDAATQQAQVGARDAEAEEARQTQAAHDSEMRRQQAQQTALEEGLRRDAAGRSSAQEAASRRGEPESIASRQRHAEEERRATDLMNKEKALRSRELEIERKMKELEVKERLAARQNQKDKEKRERDSMHEAADRPSAVAASASAPDMDEVPNEYLCPITMDLMKDPVIAMDGHTYDRPAISNWLQKSQKSPKTNTLLPSKQLLQNHALRSMIIEWLERHPNYKD